MQLCNWVIANTRTNIKRNIHHFYKRFQGIHQSLITKMPSSRFCIWLSVLSVSSKGFWHHEVSKLRNTLLTICSLCHQWFRLFFFSRLNCSLKRINRGLLLQAAWRCTVNLCRLVGIFHDNPTLHSNECFHIKES